MLENRRHRFDGRERLEMWQQILFYEDTCFHCCIKGIVTNGIPTAKDDVVDAGKRHQILDQWAAIVGALSQTDVCHLGEGANRLGQPLLQGHDASVEGGSHRAHSWR